MEKVVLTLWRPDVREPPALQQWADETVPRLRGHADVIGARVLVEAPEGAALRYGTPVDGMVFCGSVSLWVSSYQQLGQLVPMVVHGPVARTHGYLVSESVVLGYPETLDWSEAARSPGLTQVTLFDKKPGVTDEEFFHIWHTLHRQTTLDLHPVWVYVRNEVVRGLTPRTPPLRGIVYENTRTAQDMLDPHRFFGAGADDAALKRNIEHVMTETGRFIDYATIQTAVMHEYLVRRVST